VAEKVGFEEFVRYDLPQVNSPVWDHMEYIEIPRGLEESFLANRDKWIDAFVKVYSVTNYLPPLCALVEEEYESYRHGHESSLFHRIAPKIISRTKKDWESIFAEEDVSPAGTELHEFNYQVSTREENRIFMNLVRTMLESPLRVVELPEKVYLDPEDSAPFGVKVIEVFPDWLSRISYFAKGLECDFPIIESLICAGLFDKRSSEINYLDFVS
jgi:hypothetical protein